MISKRALQILRFGRALKRFEFDRAGRELGIDIRSIRKRGLNRRRTSKQFASNFLEYSFGWAPLVADIHNGVRILADGIPAPMVKGFGSDRSVYHNKTEGTFSTQYTDAEASVVVGVGARVLVVNSDLHLANQLGLLNPLSTAWELVPFSFIVDYFVNVGDFLSGISDFAGLSLTDAYTSTKGKYWESFVSQGRPGNASAPYRRFGSEQFIRSLGIASPTLAFRPLTGLSVSRGATSVALLVSFLKTR
jgi:hypothetical protein